MTEFYGTTLPNRLMLGTAQYPSPAILAEAFRLSGASVATVSLRREGGALTGGGRAGDDFWRLIRELGVRVLPNTAGCHSVKEAITTAQMAREVFQTPWIKLEIIGHAETLQPDPFALPEAARLLTEDGFQVFPYTTEDLILAEHLLEAGCEVLMPWGAPIGTGLGLTNTYGLRAMRAR
ncbi:MAG: thiazole synthase, partial [Pseudomonadota bacterium]